jgi:fatty acid desaturase/nitrite reductase/ring-hydroxylating ferredoxin subunit
VTTSTRPYEPRDYGLAGPETEHAVAEGLAEAEWYRSPIDPALLQTLSTRTDARAAFDAVLWLVLLLGSGAIALANWGNWWVFVPAYVVYSALYGGAADPRWHECGHGTAFKTDLFNTVLYYPASFMLFRGPTHWRWSHVRHHSDTIIVGRDAEIVFPRPSSTVLWFVDLLHIVSGPKMLKQMAGHAGGRLEPGVQSFVPARAQRRVVWEARISLAILIGAVVWSLVARSWLPVLFIGGPTFLGSWLLKFFGTTQHAGLQEDVLDHRYNTRTVLMNPVFRFLYLNMNYHIEHHMFPVVPYRNLPRLHEAIKDDLPEPHPNNLSAYQELFKALKEQRADQSWEVEKDVPGGEPDVGAGTVASNPAPLATESDLVVFGSDGIVDVPVSDDTDGAIVRIDVADSTYAAYRLNGQWFVTDGICTHSKQVHLSTGVLVDGQIECPRHNGRFDIVTGEPTRAPVCDALRTYSTKPTATGFCFQP